MKIKLNKNVFIPHHGGNLLNCRNKKLAESSAVVTPLVGGVDIFFFERIKKPRRAGHEHAEFQAA
ncbi:MAG TPA: hypothetical protein VGE28_18225 [Pseudomonas sp.]